jgi:spermidine synthase
MSTHSATRLRPLLFALFTVSGFSGLIYESVWSHYLKLVLGHAAYAQTLVLAIFMGGMALGAWLVSRHSDRARNPLMLYAVIEALIGVLGLGFHTVFVHIQDWLYFAWIPALDNPQGVHTLKWTLATLLILPQSVLLGTTFPLMSAAVVRLAPASSGSSLAMLYFTNSIGAAAGALVSVFVLVPWAGLPGTILTAGLLNVGLAVVVYFAARERHDPSLAREPEHSRPALLGLLGGVLVAALVTGGASFLYEVAWIRMLSLVLGSTMQSFELMLSAFITGLAFGGLWIRRRIDRIGSPLRFAGHVQVIMGLLALATVPLYDYTFDLMGFMYGALAKNPSGYALFNLTSHLIALLVMLPATFMAGMTLPLFTYALLRRGAGEASIGRVYAANTVGAIAGVLVGVHVVMPALGTKGLVSLGAALDIVLGLALLAAVAGRLRRWELPASAAASLAILFVVVAYARFDPLRLGSGVYRVGISRLSEEHKVLFHRDGKTASVDLLEAPPDLLVLSTNGKPDASIRRDAQEPSLDEATQLLTAVLPLALHPEARNVAVIGLGSGMTTHTLLAVEGIERVDTVEIEAAMIEGARGFGERVARTFSDPRSHLHVEDAKSYFAATRRRYDIIVSEPSNPWVSGVASLFTREFYRDIQPYLKDDGLLVQWFQLYEANPALLASVLKALAAEFPHYAVYNTDHLDVLIVASRQRDLSRLDGHLLDLSSVRTELARVGIASVDDLAGRRLGTDASLTGFFEGYGVPANSDFFPFLQLNAPKARYLRQTAEDLSKLHLAPVPVLELVGVKHRVREAPPSPRSTFPLDQATRQAQAIRAAWDGAGDPGDKAEKAAPLPDAIAFLLQALDCPAAATGEVWRLRQAAFQLAVAVNPYLSPDELEPLWSAVVNAPVFAAADAATRDWLALHQAIARRDGQAMTSLATRILERGPAATPAQRRYLALAGLGGALATGRADPAREFWQRFGGDLLAGRPPDFTLMWLLYQAQAAQTAARTPLPQAG